jgi:hypothetical protein
MKRVVCVNYGTKYPKEYTERLYNMVKRNTTFDFEFYVLTDNLDLYPEDHFIVVPLDGSDQGWWNKMSLFKEGVLPDGDYLYLDLDVVIVSSIDDLFVHKEFGIIRDFIRPNDGLLPGPEYNSSVMKFSPQNCRGIYSHYINNKQTWLDYQKRIHFFGDQNVISNYLNYYPAFCNPFPDEWLWSYKKGVDRGKTAGDRSQMFGRSIPKDGKVCIFHGNPNPTEVLDVKWVRENYR